MGEANYPMNMDYSPYWETETGLPDDFDLTITEAAFETDERYLNGTVPLLTWRGFVNNDPADIIDPPVRFPVGSGWQIEGGGPKGRRVVSDVGKVKFHRSSWAGRLVERVKTFPEAAKVLFKRGAPTDASVWVGTKWHLKRETAEFGREIGEKEHLMPVKFLGVVDLSTISTVSVPTVPTVSVPTAPGVSAASTAPATNLDDVLIQLARQCATFDEFKQKALQIPNIVQNPLALQQIISETGYWARR